MKTIGERRVRTEFNPSKTTGVDIVKQDTAKLIDLVESSRSYGAFVQGSEEDAANQERNRCIALAQTHYETASMFAVKALTV